MGRSPCCDESGLKKGPWTSEEDEKLIKYIQKHGHGSWRALPKLAGLNRCGKSCRLRWTNYLRPDIKRGKFSQEEEQTILNLHAILGNKWSAIATHLPGRTDNEIKNFWNTHLKKKLIQMGFDPMTHRPRTDIFSSLPHLIALASLKELIENPNSWEEQAIRLQTEAIQMARLNQYLQCVLQQQPINNNNNPITNDISNFQNINMLTTTSSDAFNLLNSSIKDTSSILRVLENQHAPPPSFDLQDFNVQFSHLPDLQAVTCDGNMNSNNSNGNNNITGDNCNDSVVCDLSVKELHALSDQCSGKLLNGQGESLMTWHPVASSLSPPENSMTNNNSGGGGGDACSTSSYGGAQLWSELLDDPLFHEIA